MSEEQPEISNQTAEAKSPVGTPTENVGAPEAGAQPAIETVGAPEADVPPATETAGAPEAKADVDSADSDVQPIEGKSASEEKPKKKTPVPDTPEQREANKKSLEEIVQRLEELATTADKLKTAERWLTKADQRLSEMGPLPQAGKVSLMKSFADARRKLFIRTGELREADEWKRWANVPKQEALIVRVEELGKSENRKGLAKKLKAAQSEWKEVGPAPRDKAQELWNRFKAACDRAYVTVKAERVEQQAEQKVNLEKKLLLCRQAEELASTDD